MSGGNSHGFVGASGALSAQRTRYQAFGESERPAHRTTRDLQAAAVGHGEPEEQA